MIRLTRIKGIIMGRHRKKPNFDSSTALQEQIAAVAAYFGEPYDDRLPVDKDHVTLRDVAETFEITILKARKMLITAGVYSTRLSRQVQELSSEGKSQLEIMNITRLSRASVQSYLPYSRVIYNMPERSVDADRKKLQRNREVQCKEFIARLPYMPDVDLEDQLWSIIVLHQGCIFYTAKKLRFRYRVKGGEILVDRKKDSITKPSVMIALHKTLELNGSVSGPKKLGIFGASYIYSIFKRIGLIESEDA